MKLPCIGIFGGSFDPIHYGHLRIANALYQQLHLQELRFIPCQKAVLDKTLQATPEQRLHMLQLAIKNYPGFNIDERELRRQTPSYTVDTLISLRNDLSNDLGKETAICFIIGSDALNHLFRWHRWQELLQLAHLIVVPRPDYALPQQGAIAELIQQHQINDAKLLHQNSAGYLWIANLPFHHISATHIRQQIALGLKPNDLLPDDVLQYIQQEHLYRS